MKRITRTHYMSVNYSWFILSKIYVYRHFILEPIIYIQIVFEQFDCIILSEPLKLTIQMVFTSYLSVPKNVD